tara:strand:- start:432 stop:716 length:285 start_codon:yes stop_codon:yes gene_type:complete
MMNFIVIGICLLLLVLVVFISAKPISMGIEARRNLKDNENGIGQLEDKDNYENNEIKQENKKFITDEIIKLNNLKNSGILTEEEYQKAKKKLLD